MTSEEHGNRLRIFVEEVIQAIDLLEFKKDKSLPAGGTIESLHTANDYESYIIYNIYSMPGVYGVETANDDRFLNNINFNTSGIRFNSTHFDNNTRIVPNTYLSVPYCSSDEEIFQQSTIHDMLGLKAEDFERLNTLLEKVKKFS